MPVEDFKKQPSKENHDSYNDSLFTTFAPEYSTGEVLLGSAYRELILGMLDREVDLDEIDELPKALGAVLGETDIWNRLILQTSGIASPPPRRSPRRQLMPLVPQIAKHACVLGGKRSRWYPANLMLQVIGAGLGKQPGEALVKQLGDALQVGQDDDILARFISRTLDSAYPGNKPAPYPSSTLNETRHLRAFRGQSAPTFVLSPAERFCKDLDAVLELKDRLTRRQWTVLVEALLRLGLAMHVLWVCHVNDKCWQLVLRVAEGEAAPSAQEIEELLWGSNLSIISLFEVGRDAKPRIEELVERYVAGRFGLNLLLHRLEDTGQEWPKNLKIGFSANQATPTPNSIEAFLKHVSTYRVNIDASSAAGWLQDNCADLLDKNAPLVKSDSGFTNNLVEFIRHSLGQLDAGDPEQVSYDQSYLLTVTGRARGRRWMVQPGPAMLIMLVHACCHDQEGIPASLEDLRLHLASYGLHVPAGELSRGDVGTDLEKLGLVVDSPDAAGGRLLVPPFDPLVLG